ncbi:MAG: type II secretion system F family protein [Armatimonadetes bacterium]|nr:type II secretion system F family protein [Armatimonadota bacterium]
MTTFAYTAVEPSGRKKSGFIEAMDATSAIAAVTAAGRQVLDIREQDGGTKKGPQSKSIALFARRASKADLALFSRRLSDLTGAGLPIDRVLQVLGEQSESPVLVEVAAAALIDVKEGLPLSQALAKFPKLFPQIYTQTLRAGEQSGQFSESADRLADLQENEVARHSQIISALIYPMVLTFVAIIVVIVLLTFVIPKLSGVFADQGEALPLATKILLGTSGFMIANWLPIVIVTAAVIVLGRIWLSSDVGRLARDTFALRAPGFGKLLRKAIIARYSRVLGTLIKGGVPILDSIKLAGLAAGNKVFEAKNKLVADDIREGKTIAAALVDADEFPPVLTHMVAIGEETGDLPKMLGRVADSLDFEVEQGLRRLTSMVEPIIVVGMGAFVAFIVLSIMLPIFQAQELIR